MPPFAPDEAVVVAIGLSESGKGRDHLPGELFTAAVPVPGDVASNPLLIDGFERPAAQFWQLRVGIQAKLPAVPVVLNGQIVGIGTCLDVPADWAGIRPSLDATDADVDHLA
jgi:hypothetical protein